MVRVSLGLPLQVDPTNALIGQVWEAAGNVEWLRGVVADMEHGAVVPGAFGDAKLVVKLYNEERDRLARLCKMAIDSGLAERQVRLAEKQGALVVGVILAVLGSPELRLSPEQVETGRRLAATRLRAVGE